ncbi:MAG: C39 family peptidase [Firmicutes bacterium]|nr:C39 family peptidase [Bacillota bacterium]
MSHLIADVPFISQLEKYPTGCESVSAVMLLNCLGIRITPEAFIDRHLPKGKAPLQGEDGIFYGCDPWQAFPGDPYSRDGWGCFAPALKTAVLSAVKECAEKPERFNVSDQYHLPLPQVVHQYIDRDIPVVFWATIGMAEGRNTLRWQTPEGRQIQWVSPMHCTLLIGYETGPDGEISAYVFNDPTSGALSRFDAKSVEAAYQVQHEQILTIEALPE